MNRALFHGRNKLIVRVMSQASSRILIMLALAFLVLPANAKVEAVPGEYVVKLKSAPESASLRMVSEDLGVKVLDFVRKDIVLVKKAENKSGTDFVNALESNPNVAIVEPNYIYKIVKVPNDPLYGKLWGMKNNGDLDSSGARGLAKVDIGAEQAWDITTGSKKVKVAVIDTGVDYTHPDLASNIYMNEAEANGQPGIDDDGNGFIDDIHGYDFSNNDGDPMDDNSHGSHCSGTIGGHGDDGVGVVGVNWDVTIVAVKFLSAQGGGTLANAVKAIDYATAAGVDIMSNSWGGGGYSELLKQSIERARDKGILFVAAAGNDGLNNDKNPSYPASYEVDNVVSVAAVDNRGDLASFSCFGAKSVHVAAPGVNVLSSVLKGGTSTYSGTSMATPHVAGVAALLKANEEGLTYTQIKERLMKTAKPLAGLKGKVASGGLVDAFYALTNGTPPADPNDPSMWTNRDNQTVSTAHPYPDDTTTTWTITVPSAKRISLHFSKFETQRIFDKVFFTNAKGESLGSWWAGTREAGFSPIADGDTINIKMVTNKTGNGYGFDVDYVVFE